MDSIQTCSVEECERAAVRRGMCNMHYRRSLRWGDPMIIHTATPSIARWFAKVDFGRVEDACWCWTAGTNRAGYGEFNAPAGASTMAHRFGYEALVRPLLAEETLDHICRNRSCVRPSHLEPVSSAENKRRGLTHRLANGMDTKCTHGHEYTPDNTYTDPKGGRRCRECARINNRKRVSK